MWFNENLKNLSQKENEKTVIDYYDIATEPYLNFWSPYFHEAFFENDKESFDFALERTHKLFIKDSNINKDGSAIDLGCGIGSFCIYLSDNVGCKVTGITVSEFQLKKATKLAKKNKNVSFKLLNILNLDSLNEKFDAGFYLDVGCYLPDKEKAIKKIFDSLKPGGRLVMTDWLQKEKPNSFEKELLIEPFNYLWRFPYMETFNGYKKIFRKVGFKIIKFEDVSKVTERNWNMMYNVAIKNIQDINVKKMLKYINNPKVLLNLNKFVPMAKRQFYANYFIKICYDSGVFKYGYFVLEKPKK